MEADNDDYDEMDEAMYAMNDNNIDFDMFPSGKYYVHNHLCVPLSKMPKKMPKKCPKKCHKQCSQIPL